MGIASQQTAACIHPEDFFLLKLYYICYENILTGHHIISLFRHRLSQENAHYLRHSLTTLSRYSICIRASYWTEPYRGVTKHNSDFINEIKWREWLLHQQLIYLVRESGVNLLLQAFHDFRISCQIVGQESESDGTRLVTSKQKHCRLRNDLMISETCQDRRDAWTGREMKGGVKTFSVNTCPFVLLYVCDVTVWLPLCWFPFLGSLEVWESIICWSISPEFWQQVR